MPAAPASPAALTPVAPECPRCGYDQSGETMTWQESCPLVGQCPECGLEFRWYDIFRGRYSFPKWSYEHARRGLPCARAFAQTLARCCTPWRLWRDLKMEHPVARVRLGIVALAGFVLSFGLTFGFAVGAAALSAWSTWGAVSARHAVEYLVDQPFAFFPEVLRHRFLTGELYLDRWFLLTGWTVLTSPLLLYGLRGSLRLANIRPENLARIRLYGLVPIPLVLGAWYCAANVVGAACGVPAALGSSPLGAAVRSIVEPLALWLHRHYDWCSLLLISAAYTLTWLWLAYQNYLELPHAFWVALASVLISIGIGLGIIGLFVTGGLTSMM